MRLKLKLNLWVRIVIGVFQRQMRQIRVTRYLFEIVPEFLPFKCQHTLILGVDRRYIWNVTDWCLLIHTVIELLWIKHIKPLCILLISRPRSDRRGCLLAPLIHQHISHLLHHYLHLINSVLLVIDLRPLLYQLLIPMAQSLFETLIFVAQLLQILLYLNIWILILIHLLVRWFTPLKVSGRSGDDWNRDILVGNILNMLVLKRFQILYLLF
jgi:hypothetical protein